MKRSISIPAVLFLTVLVHVDWHLGRAHHHRLSMEWEYHWITGLIGFFLVVLMVARKHPEKLAPASGLNILLGLVLGQIVEPLLEVVGYRVSVATALPPERWPSFFSSTLPDSLAF